MDLNTQQASPQQALPPSNTAHHHNKIVNSNSLPPISISKNVALSTAEGTATTERVPTSTWGPFTIVVVVFLVILTCFILNCSRIRRTVSDRRMERLGRSGPFKTRSFERRHKELQEADLEWNNTPPMVIYEDKMILATPESIHCSKHSSLSSCTDWSSNSTLSAAQQSHLYNDINFIKNQPPSIQLRLTLENASSSAASSIMMEPNSSTTASSIHTRSTTSNSQNSSNISIQRPMILPHQQLSSITDSSSPATKSLHNQSSSFNTIVTTTASSSTTPTKSLPSLPEATSNF